MVSGCELFLRDRKSGCVIISCFREETVGAWGRKRGHANADAPGLAQGKVHPRCHRSAAGVILKVARPAQLQPTETTIPKNHCKCDLFAHDVRPDRHAPRAQHGVHVLDAAIWAPQEYMRCLFVGSARIVVSGHNDTEQFKEASSSPTVNRLARLLCFRGGRGR